MKLEVQSTLMKITVAKIVLTIAEIIYQWLKSSSAITNLNSATTKTEIDTVRINYKRTLFFEKSGIVKLDKYVVWVLIQLIVECAH